MNLLVQADVMHGAIHLQEALVGEPSWTLLVPGVKGGATKVNMTEEIGK